VHSTPHIDRPKGRPRDSSAKEAVLDAALALAESGGMTPLSIDGIAALSGVSKPTIYRWWPNKASIVIEALLAITTEVARYPETGNVANDLRSHCRRYARLLAGPHGNAYRVLFAEAQHDENVAKALTAS
jgi:AcrR family transcriptional regulator